MSERRRAEPQHSPGARRRARSTVPVAARTVLSALVLGGLLGGCVVTPSPVGGAATPSIGSAVGVPATAPRTATTGAAAPTTAAGEGPVGPEEQGVAGVLRTYLGAVASNDFGLACAQMTVESSTALTAAVQTPGFPPPACPEALAAVLGQPGAFQTAIEAFSTLAVQDVAITGLTATVRWSSVQRGVARTDAVTMQSVDGLWLLAGPA